MIDLYQSQRAMRNMRKAAMQRGVIAILDIGTSKIACLVLRFDGPEKLREIDGVGPMAGQSSFRVIGAATTRSRGVRFGEISVMNETEKAIRTVAQAAQKMANVRVDHVIACFSGAEPRSYGLAGEWELQDSVVTEQDVAHVLAACDVPDIGQGREVLHAQPVNFALDHRTGLGDPRGQIGNRGGIGGAEPAVLHQTLRSGTGWHCLIGLCGGDCGTGGGRTGTWGGLH
jgi:cell division protein FtsA